MASSTIPLERKETFGSEPVIVNNPVEDNDKPKPKEETIEERIKKLEQALEANDISITVRDRERERERSPIRERIRSPVRYVRGGRSRSRSPIRQTEQIPLIANSIHLNAILEKPDSCAEVQSGPDLYTRNLVYVTNNPVHATDLEKVSWILKTGVTDGWVQKPIGGAPASYQIEYLPPGRRGREYVVDEPYDRYDRGPIAKVALGTVLKTFKDDTEESGTPKVKFVAVVQGKTQLGWAKLVVSYSRQAALTDLVHEIINGQAVLFVGAVLKDVVLPVEIQKLHSVQFQKVETIKEAEEVGEGVIGVIC
jgi:hypothetical protein